MKKLSGLLLEQSGTPLLLALTEPPPKPKKSPANKYSINPNLEECIL